MKARDFLARLREHVEIITSTVEREFISLSDHALNKKENPDHWSILECFEHLNRYNAYYLNEIERSLALGKPVSPETEINSTWLGKMSINMMRPENRKKQKTFSRMNPANSRLDRSVLNIFLRDQRKLAALLTQFTGLNNRGTRLEFFKLFSITSAEALEFVVVHEQRHLIQAMNAKSTIVTSPVLSV